MNGAKVLALCGGIGGAKLALGLDRLLPAHQLTVIVNTGDDFEHLGLHISPDLDTVLYTLGGVSDLQRGWGRADETWNFMVALAELGGEKWFQLGDRDLAMHVTRTHALASGRTLSDFAQEAAIQLGIKARIAPMSDDPIRTMVITHEGELAFQRYFVERRCEPVVKGIRFDGVDSARLSAVFREALADPELCAIIICPSNPYLSIDPILEVPGVKKAFRQSPVPIIAVSPIIGGQAVKGPLSKIMKEFQVDLSSSSIAAHYAGLIDGLIIDVSDVEDVKHLSVPTRAIPTLMRDLDDRVRLARDVLSFAHDLAAKEQSALRAGMR